VVEISFEYAAICVKFTAYSNDAKAKRLQSSTVAGKIPK
jgi:hypothetical protein